MDEVIGMPTGMRVLMTGADGYIGIRMADLLMRRGHDVTGLDTGFHRAGWLYAGSELRPRMLTADTRDIGVGDLAGFAAVVHLAELSNDPVGELNADVTFEINHRATVRLAELARQAGVSRFVHMSSCSVYGAAGERASREGDPTEPLTAYARSKVMVENDVSALACKGFAPTFLRNSTAFGASPRQRFDLVVNDLAASAFLYKEIRLASDGTPWRPFVHILDIAHAVDCVLKAPEDVVANETFNVGANEMNHQVRDIANLVGSLVPGCAVIFGEPGADRRNYRADFTKIHEQLPGFHVSWSLERGLRELLDVFERIGFDEDMYRWRGHTRLKQIRYLSTTGQVDDHLRWSWTRGPEGTS
jgi:nucleoside-diphosphate-sugar epimerase